MPENTTPDRKGKRYESRQDEGRIVRVLHEADPDRKGRPRWLVESLANPGLPVGRRTKVGEHTIRSAYRELSH